jgi:hypothetical protein
MLPVLERFSFISISHCIRECNDVAHELARQALVGKNSFVWIDEPGPCLSSAAACKRCNYSFPQKMM